MSGVQNALDQNDGAKALTDAQLRLNIFAETQQMIRELKELGDEALREEFDFPFAIVVDLIHPVSMFFESHFDGNMEDILYDGHRYRWVWVHRDGIISLDVALNYLVSRDWYKFVSHINFESCREDQPWASS